MAATERELGSLLRRIAQRGNLIPSARYRGASGSWAVDLVADSMTLRLRNDAGRFTVGDPDANPASLTITASDDTWATLLGDHRPPGLQTLFGAFITGQVRIRSDELFFDRHLFLLELLLGTLDSGPQPAATPATPSLEPITGRYVNLVHDGVPYRVYFEEAGTGTPLLCLHTAGADGRQYRAILTDPEITAHHRVIVFDLPRHGKSSPPPGYIHDPYLLSTDFYVAFVMTMIEALRLERPVIMGCSIGGRAVLHLALRHSDRLCAAIGLQSALYAEAGDTAPYAQRRSSSLYRPDVASQELAAAQVAGIMAPDSPPADKWETLWHYMQGGPGVFLGDLYYYFVDGDLRNGRARNIDTTRCPIYLLTGEYDLSATPAMAAELAREIRATHFEVMAGLGHFPMSENPQAFRGYLLPILARIREST